MSGKGDDCRSKLCSLGFRGLAKGFEIGLSEATAFCFPLSFFWGEKGLKLARGAVVSTKREAECSNFGGLEPDGVCRGGVEGGSLGCEKGFEAMVAALDNFL